MPRSPANKRGARGCAAWALIAAAALASLPAQAQRKPEAQLQLYERCMALARANPSQAYTQALDWRSHGGGYPAEHCEALALFELKNYDEAATRLHDVAEGTAAENPSQGVEAYDQAARAWFMANKPEKARAEYNAALKLSPKNVDMLIGRAQANGLAKDFWAALDDLNAALDIDPRRVDALTLRAATYRHVEAYDLGMQDANRAIALQPKFPDAYLERGTLYAVAGDYDDARKDWKTTIQLAPEGFLATQAQKNLAEVDRLSGGGAQPAAPSKPGAKPAPKP